MTASCSWSVASRWATATSRADCAWAALTDYGAGSLNAFIARNIAPASTAKTDGWAGYAGVPVNQHDPHVIGAMAAHLVLPWIHQMFSNLKGWARGVYHGLRRKYLQTYLDEFVFRFNRRRTRHATFRSLFAIAIRANLSPTTCWLRRNKVHKRFNLVTGAKVRATFHFRDSQGFRILIRSGHGRMFTRY